MIVECPDSVCVVVHVYFNNMNTICNVTDIALMILEGFVIYYVTDVLKCNDKK